MPFSNINLYKDDLYEKFLENQNLYLLKQNKEDLKTKSVYFTPRHIIDKMLETIDIKLFSNNDYIRILEPSAGGGMLILAIVFHLVENGFLNIEVDAFEIDDEVYKVLEENINYLIEACNDLNVMIKINTRKANFIEDKYKYWDIEVGHDGYDIIMSNPPYKKINKCDKDALALKSVVFGQPNLYSLFMALSLRLLNKGGIYIVLSPRNYLSGLYNKKLRKLVFKSYKLINIHSFYDRSIFKSVNQEVIISTFLNECPNDDYRISISYNHHFEGSVPFSEMVYDKELDSLIVPKSYNDIRIFSVMSKFGNKMNDLGLDISVGPVVQFRENLLSEDIYNEEYAPLLVAKDLSDKHINKIDYYDRETNRITHKKSISIKSKNLISNSNYVILRKIMAKDDKKLIVSSVLENSFFKHELLGIDNNLLYFHNKDKSKGLTLDICYGIYCYINTRYFKKYYSLINSTHTINVGDFSNIKFPDLDIIISMGQEIRYSGLYTEEKCNHILEKFTFVSKYELL